MAHQDLVNEFLLNLTKVRRSPRRIGPALAWTRLVGEEGLNGGEDAGSEEKILEPLVESLGEPEGSFSSSGT